MKYKVAGDWVKRERWERDWSLRQFSSMIGCSPSFLTLIEEGNNRPGIEIAKAIHLYLKPSNELWSTIVSVWTLPERETIAEWEMIQHDSALEVKR